MSTIGKSFIMSWCSSTCLGSSAGAAALLQQFHSAHANVSSVSFHHFGQPHHLPLHTSNAIRHWQAQRLTVCAALPPRQQQQRQTPSHQGQQAKQHPLLSLQGRQGGYQHQQQPQLRRNMLQQQGSQQQLAHNSQQQTLQPHQQPQQLQQRKQKFVWGYIDGNNADDWTWDDDYNEDAIAKAAAEARQLPPTPRQVQIAAAAAAATQQRPIVITRLPEQFNRQVLSNAVLLVDKPARWSSTDVVRQLKSALKYDKICFGAPLDTEATGLLIVLLGAASRLTPKLEPLERIYTGTLRLGISTNTYDASGEVLESSPWQHITNSDLSSAAEGFVGEVQQLPSMWSSSKYKNKPLRWYAERGEVVAREPKSVYITSIQLWRGPQQPHSNRRGAGSSGSSGAQAAVSDTVFFRVVASKGASVRVLVHDLGRVLGCGAHVTAVRREGIGGFSVETAWSLDTLLPLTRKYAKGFRQAPQDQGVV